MKINGIEFIPDEDHDWVYVINSETQEHFKYNQNLYSKINGDLGNLTYKKLVNGFWKSEEVRIETIEKTTLGDYLKSFIEKRNFVEFIKNFIKYSPCIEDSEIVSLLHDYAKMSFRIGIDCEVNPFFAKDINFYLKNHE